MKKVLMIIPNAGFGGAQRVFHEVAIALATEYEVIECVFNFDFGHAYPTGNPIRSLEVPAGTTWFSKAVNFVKRVLRLRQLKRELAIDIAISHLEGADYVNILSARSEKVVLCIHGSKSHDQAIAGWLGWVRKRLLIPALYQRADRLIAVSEGIKNELLSDYGLRPDRLCVIENGTDLNVIRASANQALPAHTAPLFEKPVLITHGRLAPEKNHRLLISLFADPAWQQKYHLVLIGSGPEMDRLTELAALLHLDFYDARTTEKPRASQSVFFMGYQDNPFVFLQQGSVFLFPSLFEGFPMALIEAMTCGLPVVARNCPYGPQEILNPRQEPFDAVLETPYGYLVAPHLSATDEQRWWAWAIDRLVNEGRAARGSRAQLRSQDFTLALSVQKWRSEVASCLSAL